MRGGSKVLCRGEPPAKTAPKKPTAEDFSGGAVQRAVFAQTIQHPATTCPLAVAAIAAFWSWQFGLSPESLAALIGCTVLGLGAWVVNFFFRGEKLAEKHVAKLRARLAEFELDQAANIEGEFEIAGFEDGAKEARELRVSYEKLRNFLREKQKDRSDPSIYHYEGIARDSYKAGISALTRALRVFQAYQNVDASALEQEIRGWQRQLRSAGATEQQALNRKIESHKKRLATIEESKALIATLIAQSNELEGALEAAYLELAELLIDDGSSAVSAAESVTRLEQAIAATREIEETLGNVDRRPDDIVSA